MTKIRNRPICSGFFWYKDSLDENWMIVEVSQIDSKQNLFIAENQGVNFEFNGGEINKDDELEFWSDCPVEEHK